MKQLKKQYTDVLRYVRVELGEVSKRYKVTSDRGSNLLSQPPEINLFVTISVLLYISTVLDYPCADLGGTGLQSNLHKPTHVIAELRVRYIRTSEIL